MGTINFRGSKNFDVVGVGYKEYTDEADLNANLKELNRLLEQIEDHIEKAKDIAYDKGVEFEYEDFIQAHLEHGYYSGCIVVVDFEDTSEGIMAEIDSDPESWYVEHLLTDEYLESLDCMQESKKIKALKDNLRENLEFTKGYLEYALIRLGYEMGLEQIVGISWTQSSRPVTLEDVKEYETQEYKKIFEEI